MLHTNLQPNDEARTSASQVVQRRMLKQQQLVSGRGRTGSLGWLDSRVQAVSPRAPFS